MKVKIGEENNAIKCSHFSLCYMQCIAAHIFHSDQNLDLPAPPVMQFQPDSRNSQDSSMNLNLGIISYFEHTRRRKNISPSDSR
jgi:hypothetical protein